MKDQTLKVESIMRYISACCVSAVIFHFPVFLCSEISCTLAFPILLLFIEVTICSRNILLALCFTLKLFVFSR